MIKWSWNGMCRECGEMREDGHIPGDGETRTLHGGETEFEELSGKEILSARHIMHRLRYPFLFFALPLPFTFNDVIIKLPRSKSSHLALSAPPPLFPMLSPYYCRHGGFSLIVRFAHATHRASFLSFFLRGLAEAVIE